MDGKIDRANTRLLGRILMQAAIKKQNAQAEFETQERCFITEVANDPNDPDVSIALARVEPGIMTAWHQLNGVAERYLITKGLGSVEVGNLPATAVTVGDIIQIPPDTPQRITNTGATDLEFYAICSPRFTPACYINLDAPAQA
jgi:mannose-6-phosphate isomerase-like protein (cupin superfamily)